VFRGLVYGDEVGSAGVSADADVPQLLAEERLCGLFGSE
jgi:hypothetical protein